MLGPFAACSKLDHRFRLHPLQLKITLAQACFRCFIPRLWLKLSRIKFISIPRHGPSQSRDNARTWSISIPGQVLSHPKTGSISIQGQSLSSFLDKVHHHPRRGFYFHPRTGSISIPGESVSPLQERVYIHPRTGGIFIPGQGVSPF